MRYYDPAVRTRPPSLICLLLWPLLLLAGCPPPAARPYPPPTAQALLAHLRVHTAALLALSATAKADYLDGKDRVKITVSLLAARPDRLRLSGESTLTGPLVTLATDGKEFQLLDVQHGRFLAGDASPCNVARLIRVELPPADVVAVLLGGVAPLAAASATVGWDSANGGREVLTLRDEGGRVQVIWLDARERRWDVLAAELRDPAGRLLYRVRHEGFAPTPLQPQVEAAQAQGPSVRLPATSYIEDPPHKSDVRLRWRERQPNPSLPDGAFQLTTPAGVSVEAATCSG